jgi:hypothetical protein
MSHIQEIGFRWLTEQSTEINGKLKLTQESYLLQADSEKTIPY